MVQWTTPSEDCGEARVKFQAKKNPGLFSRVMTRPAGRATVCSKCHGSGPFGSESVQNLTGRIGSGQKKGFQISRVGSDRVGSGRVGSGRVNNFSNLTGRVTSSRARKGSLAGRASMTRAFFCAVPRVGPADQVRGSDTSKGSRFSARRIFSRNHSCSIIIPWYHNQTCTPKPLCMHMFASTRTAFLYVCITAGYKNEL